MWVAGGAHLGKSRAGQVSFFGAASSLQTSWRGGCFCRHTSWVHCCPSCSLGTARSGWIFDNCRTTKRLCTSQHISRFSSDHYPCPWCWTSSCCDTATSFPPSPNTSPHSTCTLTAYHQRRNCHIWHTPCLRSSPLSPLVARSVCWPSSDGSCPVPARTRRSAVQSPLCTYSSPGRSLGSRLAFSGTQSTPLRLWSCRSKLGMLLCRQDRPNTRHLWFCRTGNALSSQAVWLCRGRYSEFSTMRESGAVVRESGLRFFYFYFLFFFFWGGGGGWVGGRGVGGRSLISFVALAVEWAVGVFTGGIRWAVVFVFIALVNICELGADIVIKCATDG